MAEWSLLSTRSSAMVVATPYLFLASHMYSASSSSVTLSMVSVQRPFLNSTYMCCVVVIFLPSYSLTISYIYHTVTNVLLLSNYFDALFSRHVTVSFSC